MDIEFRRLTRSDLKNFYDNRLRALKNSPSAFVTSYEEEIARGKKHFEQTLTYHGNNKAIFGALRTGDVLGTIGISRELRSKINHKAMIWGMYVDQEHRGVGIGGRLLDLAIQFARSQMSVRVIGLTVASSNRDAEKLYESRGFKVWGVEPMAMREEKQYSNESYMSLIL